MNYQEKLRVTSIDLGLFVPSYPKGLPFWAFLTFFLRGGDVLPIPFYQQFKLWKFTSPLKVGQNLHEFLKNNFLVKMIELYKTFWDHSFSKTQNFHKKLIFITLWYEHWSPMKNVSMKNYESAELLAWICDNLEIILRALYNIFNLLSANLAKWSNTLGFCRRIVWVCLTIL